MLIKSMKGRGKPAIHSPEEALRFAIEYAVSGKSTKEKIFWVKKNDFKVSKQHSTVNKGGWEAHAQGTLMLGHTVVATDKFHRPAEHNFVIHYKTAKDDLGLPDLEVVSCTLTPVNGMMTEAVASATAHMKKAEAASSVRTQAIAVEEPSDDES
jgi:hypothetical protein